MRCETGMKPHDWANYQDGSQPCKRLGAIDELRSWRVKPPRSRYREVSDLSIEGSHAGELTVKKQGSRKGIPIVSRENFEGKTLGVQAGWNKPASCLRTKNLSRG
jgi:hypothetical protein